MARPKAFDPDQAIAEAMTAFCDRGYAATSVHDLLAEMKLNRGSLYGTFGDKKKLFLAALEKYDQQAREQFWCLLDKPGPARGVIRQWLLAAGERCVSAAGKHGCMAARASMEVAPHDADVATWIKRVNRRNERAVARVVARGQAEGQINAKLNAMEIGRMLLYTIAGMLTMGVVAPSKKEVEGVIALALRVLD